ncbi:YtxH domain-containing protein [Desulfosporosinus nitroreducens]|uniref:YtxH domain-containing protein n=1 Tax=Desulfosporosinus nitroreducens TaxID=2018668 RepID=UPI00207D6760|nr:YtxH domain-containing protein [Desulfosporosinus nitroreducens]MCO1602485.1 YtxH domain-containing protein [Desulfosporosinus nitroreducens]
MKKILRTDQSPSLSTIAVAALVGGLVGSVVGLMFAPKSGRALRQGIQEKTDTVLERVGDITLHHAGTLKHQGTDLATKGKRLADDLQSFIQESLKTKKADIIVSQSDDLLPPNVEVVSAEPESQLQEN